MKISNFNTGRGIHGDAVTGGKINTYAFIIAKNVDNKTLEYSNKFVGVIGDFNANDEILIHDYQTGEYDFFIVESVSPNSITLATSYAELNFNINTSQIIKVAEYSNLTTNSIIAVPYLRTTSSG